MNVNCYWMILLGGCLLSGCAADTRMKMDDFWQSVDPSGHARSHRERYHPYERTTGLRMPKAD